MEGIVLIIVLGTVVAILNITLFFKVWGMTNNVKHMLNFLLEKSGYVMKKNEKTYEVYFEKKEEQREH